MTPLGWVACVLLVGCGALAASRGDWVWGGGFLALAAAIAAGESAGSDTGGEP